MKFPEKRQRRLRTDPTMRRLVRETVLTENDLVYPLFVCPGEGVQEPIGSLAGCYHFSPDRIAIAASEAAQLGSLSSRAKRPPATNPFEMTWCRSQKPGTSGSTSHPS